MARPKKEPRAPTTPVTTRFREEEVDLLMRAADRDERSLAGYIRTAAINQARASQALATPGHQAVVLDPDTAGPLRELMRAYSHPVGSAPTIQSFAAMAIRAGIAALKEGQVQL